jgi:hypothetical protein
MFNVGQLVWVWIKGEEPSTALVVEVAHSVTIGTYYNVLIEEQIIAVHPHRIWLEKENAVPPLMVGRRLFPGLIANQIITVQPMSLPSALPFYLDYTYGSGSKDEEDK